MEWLTAISAALQVAAWGVQQAESLGSNEVPGEKKRIIAEQLGIGALGLAKKAGGLNDKQFAESTIMLSEAVQLAFDALDMAGVVNKEKKVPFVQK